MSNNSKKEYVIKNVEITFKDGRLKACDALSDLQEAARSIAHKLYNRCDVKVQTPRLDSVNRVVMKIRLPKDQDGIFALGPHLRGIACYLMEHYNDRYANYVQGTGLLRFTEITPADDSTNPTLNETYWVEKFQPAVQRAVQKAIQKLKSSETGLRLCTVDARLGYFHCWEQYVRPSGDGITDTVSQIRGIVEFEDGSVTQVEPNKIIFCDDTHSILYGMSKAKTEE